jgi:putative hemolysin
MARNLTYFTTAVALFIGCAPNTHAAGIGHTMGLRTSSQIQLIAESRKGVKQLGGKLGGKITTTGVSELSAQDCKNVGGKVITVTDDRCGASHSYCRMPDTNAVCIDKLQ